MNTNLNLKETDYIKVALIDDGVDPDYMGLGSYLSGCGWPPSPEISYDEEDNERLLEACFTPGREQHGNKMAWLITKACPFVKIYVAKIDTHQYHQLPHPSFKLSEAVKVPQSLACLPTSSS